jgi:putative FmdB family regulatory protein
MGKYDYKCLKCGNIESKTVPMSEYKKQKCKCGELLEVIPNVPAMTFQTGANANQVDTPMKDYDLDDVDIESRHRTDG